MSFFSAPCELKKIASDARKTKKRKRIQSGTVHTKKKHSRLLHTCFCIDVIFPKVTKYVGRDEEKSCNTKKVQKSNRLKTTLTFSFFYPSWLFLCLNSSNMQSTVDSSQSVQTTATVVSSHVTIADLKAALPSTIVDHYGAKDTIWTPVYGDQHALGMALLDYVDLLLCCAQETFVNLKGCRQVCIDSVYPGQSQSSYAHYCVRVLRDLHIGVAQLDHILCKIGCYEARYYVKYPSGAIVGRGLQGSSTSSCSTASTTSCPGQ